MGPTPCALNLGTMTGVNGQFSGLAASHPVKTPWIPTKRLSEPLSQTEYFRRGKSLGSVVNPTTIPRTSNPYPSHYSEYANPPPKHTSNILATQKYTSQKYDNALSYHRLTKFPQVINQV